MKKDENIFDQIRKAKGKGDSSQLDEIAEQLKLNAKLQADLIEEIKKSKGNERIIERVVEHVSSSEDKSKTYSDPGTSFIPEIDTGGLELSIKEKEGKSTTVDVDEAPDIFND